MGDDKQVGAGLLPEGDTGVVRGDGHRLCPQTSLPAQGGDGLCGEEVRHDHAVVFLLFEQSLEVPRIMPVGQIDWGLQTQPVQVAHRVPRPVEGVKGPRRPGHHVAVAGGDSPGCAGAAQGQQVGKIAARTPAEQLLLHGAARRIMPTPRVARQNKRFDGISLLYFPAVILSALRTIVYLPSFHKL